MYKTESNRFFKKIRNAQIFIKTHHFALNFSIKYYIFTIKFNFLQQINNDLHERKDYIVIRKLKIKKNILLLFITHFEFN